MNNQFAAAPGSVLRQYDEDGDHRDYPIVGWSNITGYLAMPILTVGGQTVGPGSIIITEHNEWVPLLFSHQSSGMVFDNEEAARDHVAEYLTEHPMPEIPERASAAPAATTAATNSPRPDPRAPLHFGAKKYATKSYWSWPGQNAVFEIEADAVYPSDDRVKKIKRDEYAALKRDGATKIDPHAGEIIGETEAPAEEAEESAEDLI